MNAIKQFAKVIFVGVGLFAAGCAPAQDSIMATVPPLVETEAKPRDNSTFTLTSPMFADGRAIISQYTCDGPNMSPPLTWAGVPEGVKGFALTMDDPDAPGEVFDHWVLYNIPADRTDLPQNVAKTETVAGIGVQGKNSFGTLDYSGPCPPAGAPHRYRFHLYALDERLFLQRGASKADLEGAIAGHILAQAELIGSYQRVAESGSCCGVGE